MARRRTVCLFVAACAAASLSLAACSDGGSEGATRGDGPAASTSSAPTPPPTTADSSPSSSGADDNPGPACASGSKASAGASRVRVWFFCGPDLQPAARPSPDADLEQYLVDELISGPTPREQAAGFEGSFSSDWGAQARVSRVGETVRVDFAPRPDRQRFLASSSFLIKPIERTLKSLPGVRSVVVLYDGEDLCEISDEC